ncbi:hypothetical protein [Oerskovia flava]|uniref:hypothetical protein n=1 Tax=Oerskovia flava TaxID=2986422 RepID=UPI0022405ECB|nr:hypothetical protein [Oerskovia sp. JB1-3-2]
MLGELRYVVGHLAGRAHCALCDITHSPVRRKRAWDAMVARTGLAVQLLHRDEVPADLVAALAGTRLPLVAAVPDDGRVTVLLDAAALEEMDGSVEAFEIALVGALAGS